MADRSSDRDTSDDDDILQQAKDDFDLADENESHNRSAAEEDIKFARLNEHWPKAIRAQRESAIPPRPCLSIPILAPVIRQVVNDARQNKPQIKVGPVDSGSDPETADIYSDLIRNIESTSNADVAYDTAIECAVTNGFGYIRVGLDYAHDDTFDLDITIDRVLDPLSVYGDPDSLGADSADWNRAFIVDRVSKEKFEAEYGDAGKVDWDVAGYSRLSDKWFGDDGVLVAEYWTREEIERPICLLSDGSVISKADLEYATEGVPYGDWLKSQGITIKDERTAKSWKVKQYKLTGAEVLSERDWPGKYIPIIPVYGDEVFSEGKRYFRSLTRDAQDAQRNFNYWRTVATELVALAPRVPFIGPVGAFAADPNWGNANNPNLAKLEYGPTEDGQWVAPQRQPLDVGAAAGALQEALNASDDVKRITGIYDASLGARSNETSGKAIMARQREGDVSTFHFIDNLGRAIRHTGRVLIDLIPHVYNKERIIRVLGEDGSHRMVPLKQPVPQLGPDGKPQMQPMMGPDGRPVTRPAMGPNGPVMQPGPNGPMPAMEPVMVPVTKVYDLTAGKYDLVVKTGPSFTTRREEAATQLTEAMRSIPQAAPILLPEIFKNLDLPGADEIAQKMDAMAPKPNNGPPPEIQKQMAQAREAFEKLKAERDQIQQALQKAQASNQSEQANALIKALQMKIDAANVKIAAFKAESERFKIMSDAHINWTELGIDMQLQLADLELAHTQATQHGLESMDGAQGQPAPQNAPVPMQGPGMMQPPPQMPPPMMNGGGMQ